MPSLTKPKGRKNDAPRARLTARIPEKMRATLQDAANLTGTTVNQFVVQMAYVEAQRLLERESVLRLSREDARKVFELIQNPPRASGKLKDAVKQFKKTVCA